MKTISNHVNEKSRKMNAGTPLKCMGNNKSPGNDGLTKEFYLAFFAELQDYLLQSLNFSFHNGQLSNSQRQATITLIEKKR